MRATGDRHIVDRRQRWLFGVDDFQGRDIALFQFAAHDPRQRADGSLVNIRHFKSGRVEFVARAHTTDHGDACLLRP